MSKPIFIEMFEESHNRLLALSAMDVPKWQKEMTPEAMSILGKDLYEKLARTQGELREVSQNMRRGLETIQDLQLAKDPDVERLAHEFFIHSPRCSNAGDAFSAAEKFIMVRNERRSKERLGAQAQLQQVRR